MCFGGNLVAHGKRCIARTAAEESSTFRVEILQVAFALSKNSEIVVAYNCEEYPAQRVILMQWLSDHMQFQNLKR